MYTVSYTDSALFDPVQFQHDLANSGDVTLKMFKRTLQRGQEKLKQRFMTHKRAQENAYQRAWLVDQILCQAWQQYAWSQPNDMALIAVGGYGRGELHPASDVDLMILLRYPADEHTQQNIADFVRFLWDIKLEVGHSVRTLTECVEEATNDVTVITNLVESRLLLGPNNLFNAMQSDTAPDKIWHSRIFFAAKCDEQTKRYRKFHDTAYNLEPNIKEGPGGLRDIHMIAWVAKRHFGATTLHDLVVHDFLTEDEYHSLNQGQEFLWQIRHHLHYMTERREDRILFDYQRGLAEKFDYQDDDKQLGVEKFMRRYYRTIKELSTLNDMLLQLFEEVTLYGSAPAKIKPLNKRFHLCNEFIEVTQANTFKHVPYALLEIYLLLQQNPSIRGIRAATVRLIRQSVYLIDDVFRRDLRARSVFYEILRQPHNLTRTLRRMNAHGVLGAYIPAFGRIVGQMQYDLFHVYTVDQHTLFVVRNLRRFHDAAFKHELPFCYQINTTIPKPELLCVAGLFHDIAKGRGGDHSELGEKDALAFCQIHGFSDQDARLVAWLVRNHLLMSMTAQRKDISDSDVIRAFAQQVSDTMHLDYLYLLTVADIRATNPKLWNGWKDALLAELYRKTKHALNNGNQDSTQARLQRTKASARALMANPNDPRIDTLWADITDDYFLAAVPQTIARETSAILRHANSNEPLVMERQAKQRTEFFIYLHDRDYLFAEVTQYLEQQGLSVLEASILPTQGEHTFAIYTVLQQDGSEITNPEHMNEVLCGLRKTLNHDDTQVFMPLKRRVPRQVKHFSVATRISISPDYQNDHSIVEIVTTDRPGVLSLIAQTFMQCQVRMKRAKIATLGSRVEDIFFITDADNHALHSTEKLDQLREELLRNLDEIGLGAVA